MPIRNWLYVLALGGCLVASGGAYAQQPTERQPAPQSQAGPDAQFQSRSVLDATIGDVKKIIADEKSADESGAQRRESREEADLTAQQDMALWAQLMVYLTGASIAVGAVTLFFLILTFGEAKAATKAATRQADIALAQLAARIVVSSVSTRDAPIVVPDEPRPILPENGRQLRVMLKNIGATRAFVTRSAAVFRISKDEPSFDYTDKEKIAWERGPGIKEDSLFKVPASGEPLNLTQAERGNLFLRETRLWALVSVWFTDWFGHAREEHFLMLCYFESSDIHSGLNSGSFVGHMSEQKEDGKTNSRFHRALAAAKERLGALAT